jgi:hypothetical protein
MSRENMPWERDAKRRDVKSKILTRICFAL